MSGDLFTGLDAPLPTFSAPGPPGTVFDPVPQCLMMGVCLNLCANMDDLRLCLWYIIGVVSVKRRAVQ
jgi:hypothetical protein